MHGTMNIKIQCTRSQLQRILTNIQEQPRNPGQEQPIMAENSIDYGGTHEQ